MGITIGMMAHVDAGKTTLSEQILYHTESIRSRGRVDHGDSFLDDHAIEKERGITIFSGQAEFSVNGRHFYLVDTPGHTDFFAETERAASAADYAILVLSAVEGVQAHTENLWHMLERLNMPVFFFINKTDREGADVGSVMDQIRSRFSELAVLAGGGDGAVTAEQFAEEAASVDEQLLEKYIETGYDESVWNERIRELTAERKFFPCVCGSALNDSGVEELIRCLCLYTSDRYSGLENDPVGARVYKVRYDARGTRLTFLKLVSGTLHVRDEIFLPDGSSAGKIGEIRFYNGKKYRTSDRAVSGGVCAVSGLYGLHSGDAAGCCERLEPIVSPVLESQVIFDRSMLKQTVAALRILEDEDPSLGVSWNEALGELRVHIMGVIQYDVIRELMKERFEIDVDFGKCSVMYRETIASDVIGCGHYEPLRHYAEVILRLSPAARGEGIKFESELSTDVLELRYQRLIETHVFEKVHIGVLTGSPVTDIKVTLLNGRAHLKHTEGGDFREAVYRAIRQGLQKAESILLEPYYRYRITAPSENAGRVMSDIQRLGGTFEPLSPHGDAIILEGRGPVSTFMNYGSELAAFTGGRGIMSAVFDGYEECHNSEEVIEEIGYDSLRDTENPSSSVFCARGAGFSVRWDEVDRHIHCKIDS